ncbi:hypothetical protein ES704_00995 [subsurface metagenome]
MEMGSSLHLTQNINCLIYQFTEITKPDKIKKMFKNS